MASIGWAIVAAIIIVVMVYRFREPIGFWTIAVFIGVPISIWEWWTGKRFDDYDPY